MKDLMDSILNSKVENINPTIIYNEGWMVHLLVYYSIKYGIAINDLKFDEINNWTSESLISSPFIKVKDNPEGYTHVDIAFGDFTVDFESRGEIKINEVPKTFGIIEAKMGTKNATEYNQAIRNIACMLHNIKDDDCEIYFWVVAPQKTIDKYGFKYQIARDKVVKQLEERFKLSKVDDSNFNKMKNRIENKINIKLVTYEEWIEEFDGEIKGKLSKFYENCKKFNRI